MDVPYGDRTETVHCWVATDDYDGRVRILGYRSDEAEAAHREDLELDRIPRSEKPSVREAVETVLGGNGRDVGFWHTV